MPLVSDKSKDLGGLLGTRTISASFARATLRGRGAGVALRVRAYFRFSWLMSSLAFSRSASVLGAYFR